MRAEDEEFDPQTDGDRRRCMLNRGYCPVANHPATVGQTRLIPREDLAVVPEL